MTTTKKKSSSSKKKTQIVAFPTRIRANIEGLVKDIKYKKVKTALGVLVEIPCYEINAGHSKPVKVFNPNPIEKTLNIGSYVSVICSIKKRKAARGYATSYILDEVLAQTPI